MPTPTTVPATEEPKPPDAPPVEQQPPAVTEPPPAPSLTTVHVDVRPWARVKIVPSAPDAAEPADALYAPFALDLPPGTYTLESENGGVTRPLTFQVTVATGAPQAVTRIMPGFNATRAADSLMARFTPSATAPKGGGGALHPIGTVPNANVEQARVEAQLQAELAKSPSLAELRLLRTVYDGKGVSLNEVNRLIAAGEAVEARARGERTGIDRVLRRQLPEIACRDRRGAEGRAAFSDRALLPRLQPRIVGNSWQDGEPDTVARGSQFLCGRCGTIRTIQGGPAVHLAALAATPQRVVDRDDALAAPEFNNQVAGGPRRWL